MQQDDTHFQIPYRFLHVHKLCAVIKKFDSRSPTIIFCPILSNKISRLLRTTEKHYMAMATIIVSL